MMEQGWKKAGIIFIVATIVFTISLFLNINFYYATEVPEYYYFYDDNNDNHLTISESCRDFEGDFMCHTVEQEKYHLLGGGLVSAGLAIICFTKQDEEDNKLAGIDNSQPGLVKPNSIIIQTKLED